MHKILKISVILPYYEARYTLNRKIEIKSNSGNSLSSEYENEKVKEIIYKQTGFSDYSYIIITESQREICISEQQPGLQIIKGDENVEV